VRGQDATEAAQQITTYLPVSVHKRIKCHAIANDTSINALVLDWIEAGMKAARA
jgi:predicted HicB family RNase H-like nuclease